MRLGYSITSFHGDEPSAGADDILDRAAVAAAGYDYVETGDHHAVAGGNYLQNVPMAARLTESFDHVAPMFLLPLYHPVLVAEQVGTIAALAEQVDVWCAVGRAGPAYDAFGISPAERGDRMDEALAILDRLWDHDGVTYDGEFYHLADVSVNPKADPRICIGGSAEPAVRRAGRLGDAWVANADVPLEGVTRRLPWFADAGGGDVLLRRDVIALADGDQARRRRDALLEAGYRGWPADAGWTLAGDSDDIAADLERFRDAGIDEVIVRPMDGKHAVETLETVAAARDRL
ncbi:MAG: LLM class flavin-dependent oxidoreductase [Halobacteriales archaeon]|nr:LLM class flavin-dependent oxidoreductase [Halobacteriales archaeon]